VAHTPKKELEKETKKKPPPKPPKPPKPYGSFKVTGDDDDR
jgi:hypothetical protein